MNELTAKYYDEIQNFRFIDDVFFNWCFSRNITGTQYILRIILDKPDLIVREARSQVNLENLYGHSVRLDVLATDSTGKLYDIEIQRSNDGAVPQRARYISAMLDRRNLDKGEEFKSLPEAFVIFITENDVLKGGEQIYHIERVIKENGKNFGDGAHIIYVNGKIRGGSPLGDMMHDFFCRDPSQMKHKTLAEFAKFFKTDEMEMNVMTGYMRKREADAFARGKAEGEVKGEAKGKAEGKAEELLKNIRTMMKNLKLTAEAAMNVLEIPVEEQKELAPLI